MPSQQGSKLVIVRSSEMTKKFTGQPVFGKIKSLAACGIYNRQPSQTEKINYNHKRHKAYVTLCILSMSDNEKLNKYNCFAPALSNSK